MVRLFLTLHLDFQPLLVLDFPLKQLNTVFPVTISRGSWSSLQPRLPPPSHPPLTPLRQRLPTNWCTGSTLVSTSSLACDLQRALPNFTELIEAGISFLSHPRASHPLLSPALWRLLHHSEDAPPWLLWTRTRCLTSRPNRNLHPMPRPLRPRLLPTAFLPRAKNAVP